MSGLGNFAATFVYSPQGPTKATLTIQLTNTTPAANGGYLTAFAFNNPGNKITYATLGTTDPHFWILGRPSLSNLINSGTAGLFDIGAGVGQFGMHNFEDAGLAMLGIAIGATETFTFQLKGTGLDTLTAEDFMSTQSQAARGSTATSSFVARFRHMVDCRSDKVPGMIQDTPVPEPSAIALIVAGAGCLLARGVQRMRSLAHRRTARDAGGAVGPGRRQGRRPQGR